MNRELSNVGIKLVVVHHELSIGETDQTDSLQDSEVVEQQDSVGHYGPVEIADVLASVHTAQSQQVVGHYQHGQVLQPVDFHFKRELLPIKQKHETDGLATI